MEVRNFPPASEFVHIYKQSSLSSDYGVNVESKDTPLLVFNTSIKVKSIINYTLIILYLIIRIIHLYSLLVFVFYRL